MADAPKVPPFTPAPAVPPAMIDTPTREAVQALIDEIAVLKTRTAEAQRLLLGLVGDAVLEDGFMTTAVGNRLVARAEEAKKLLAQWPVV